MAHDPAANTMGDGCVVLTRRGGTGDADLLAACAGRGWTPVICDDPYLAAAELCLLGRPDAATAVPLVLDAGPDSHAASVEAMRTLRPTLTVWTHDQGALRPTDAPAAPAAPRPMPSPPRDPDPSDPADPDDPTRAPTQVSAEEIALLFADPRGAPP